MVVVGVRFLCGTGSQFPGNYDNFVDGGPRFVQPSLLLHPVETIAVDWSINTPDQHTPLIDQQPPLFGQQTPLIGRRTPLIGHQTPLIGQ